MKTYLQYSILVVVFIIATGVILFSFDRYNNGIAFVSSGNSASVAAAAKAATTTTTASSCNTAAFYEAVNIYNSMVMPGSVAQMTSGAGDCSFNGLGSAFVNLPTSGSTLYDGNDATFGPTNVCHTPITVPLARRMVADLTSHGINAAFITATSSLYVYWGSGNIGAIYHALTNGDNSMYSSPLYFNYGAPHVGYCLDSGYISNYPNFVSKFIAYINANPVVPVNNMTNFLDGFEYSGGNIGKQYIDPSILNAIAGPELSTVSSKNYTTPTATGSNGSVSTVRTVLGQPASVSTSSRTAPVVTGSGQAR